MNITNLSTEISNEARSRIIAKLRQIEVNYGIKIIHGVEAGSRSWGIQSPDSDYDVRFIYVQQDLRKYIGVSAITEEITEQDGNLDIKGYDIRKAYQLIASGEVNVYEWLSSEIVYISRYEDLWVIEDVAKHYFDVGTIIRKYYGMAKVIYTKDLKWVDNVKVKKYLYAVRAILCSLYVMANKEPVPLRLDKLVEYMSYNYQDELEELLTLKTDQIDNYTTTRSQSLEDKIMDELSRLEEMMRPIQKRVFVDYSFMNNTLFRYVMENYIPDEDEGSEE